MVVHDIGARRQIGEEGLGVLGRLALLRLAMGTATSGQVGLAQHRQAGRWGDEPVVQRRDGEVTPGCGQTGALRVADVIVAPQCQAGVAEQRIDPLERARTLGGDHHPVSVGEQRAEPCGQRIAPAHRCGPQVGFEDGHGRARGGGGQRPGGCGRVGEQPVEVQVQAAQRRTVGAPGAGKGVGQVGLLGEQVRRPVSQSLGLDQHHLGIAVEQVEQHMLGVGQPRQPRLHAVKGLPVGQALPLLGAPRFGGDQLAGPPGDLRRDEHLAGRVNLHLGDRGHRTLVVDRELGEPLHLVAPQVDAHRRLGGRREHVDDRAPHRHLTAMLHLVLAAVPPPDQLVDQLGGVDRVAGADDHRFGVLDVGAEALKQRPDGGDDHPGAAGRIGQAPHHPHAPAHRLGRRADPLEWQGLPGGKPLDRVGTEPRAEVVGQGLGLGDGGHRHHDRRPTRGLGHRCDVARTPGLGNGDRCGVPAESVAQRRVVTKQTGQSCQGHRSRLPAGSRNHPAVPAAWRECEQAGARIHPAVPASWREYGTAQDLPPVNVLGST